MACPGVTLSPDYVFVEVLQTSKKRIELFVTFFSPQKMGCNSFLGICNSSLEQQCCVFSMEQ